MVDKTIEEAEKYLMELGYRKTLYKRQYAYSSWQLILPPSVCSPAREGDRGFFIDVHLYEDYGFTVEAYGEVGEYPHRFSTYAIPTSEIQRELPLAVGRILSMWKAISE